MITNADIYSVKTDMKAQKLTVEGIVESDKLIGYIRKKVHKDAEIIAPKPAKEGEKKPEKEGEKKEDVKVEQVSIKTTETVEIKEKTQEVKTTKVDNVPYFIHYVYAPQLFSDENPNACYIL